ncbi:MBL fold metallo-hydrolase [Nannocystis radixulma]|uniref:MBL fold metallo-hydrolase n=1 Tax=Nannocystis radixulma TaxID=2995305 RepID=A0ABT5BK92_9BACT|nr:MBL fold metallo-hydrolase [Nannocystis radixulma]MDC0673432.1 MBL fold metallo-hydrolase [Nannocystis radixulma]
MELTYLGTATLVIRVGETRILTDPVFDAIGSVYDFGLWFTPRSWFASEKRYETPQRPASLGRFDAVLLSHDHHADNLDMAGRALIADASRVARVITTVAGARRLARPAGKTDAPGRGLGLGARAVGLEPDAQTRVGRTTITAIVARHGPVYAPQVHEVTGFVIDVDDGPRVWISGDTVLFPALAARLTQLRRERPVDLAVVHCGAVGFPRALGFHRARFTFDASEAIAACRLLDPKTILPIHRSGWAHFQQPESELRDAFAAAGLGERTRFLELGGTLEL